MTKEYKNYRKFYAFVSFFLRIIYPVRSVGSEKVPDGPAILCGNHSSAVDPFLIAMAVSNRHHIHFMAKAELFKSKLVGAVLRGIGTFPVDRGKNDISAIRTSFKYLKSGEKIGIFPEGTRHADENLDEIKNGAVRIAEKAKVPIVPVFIPRKKKIFHKVTIIVGDPFYTNPDKKKLSASDFDDISLELMRKIAGLQQEG